MVRNVILSCLILLLGFLMGGVFVMDQVKKDSIYYVCDQTTGECEFQFKGVD